MRSWQKASMPSLLISTHTIAGWMVNAILPAIISCQSVRYRVNYYYNILPHRKEEGGSMRRFTTTGVCIPEKHYMVNIEDRLAKIKKMVDDGKYFVINRARQYGKTTTLVALAKYLSDSCTVLNLSFQGIGAAGFETEQSFVQALCRLVIREAKYGLTLPQQTKSLMNDFISRKNEKANLDELFDCLLDWCYTAEKPIVMMIDEIDSATNNQVFLDFLAQLRESYLNRDAKGIITFQSVILAGVSDVRHLKSKIRDEDQHKVNSPWNIAADFNIDMSLSAEGIAGMLGDYEQDHHTGMDTQAIAQLIYDYTSGYPFLVSRICQLIDDGPVSDRLPESASAWSRTGIDEAVKVILNEKNALFDSLSGKLTNYPQLKQSLRRVLMEGEQFAYNPDQENLVQMQMYGFITNKGGMVAISNRIFETRLYNYFLSDEEMKDNTFSKEASIAKSLFIHDDQLDMPLILERFRETFTQIFGPLTDRFLEKDGRELFLLYLKPIINGTGNYYIEAQTRDQTRTDVIVDYLGHQYVIELKIWRGPRYHEDGEKQLKEYLNYFNLDVGYMLSFNFNKEKEVGLKIVQIDGKVLYEETI